MQHNTDEEIKPSDRFLGLSFDPERDADLIEWKQEYRKKGNCSEYAREALRRQIETDTRSQTLEHPLVPLKRIEKQVGQLIATTSETLSMLTDLLEGGVSFSTADLTSPSPISKGIATATNIDLDDACEDLGWE